MTAELEALETAAGASFATLWNLSLPATYGDVRAEWDAVRHGCGLLDARFRRLLRLSGEDRVTFLQGMVTNDVAKLASGEGVHAAMLTVQGRVISDLQIFALDGELWLDVPVQCADAVRASLEKHIVADDVELAEGDRVPVLSLEGPGATSLLGRLMPVAMERLGGQAIAKVEEEQFCVARVSHTGEDGFLLFAAPAAAGQLWARCRAANATPVGMEALQVLRIEAGIPWCGLDMSESVLIGEVGLQDAISFTKGCYLGQEVVERVSARGQVQRKLVGVVCSGRHVPAAGALLTRDGRDVGSVTSAAWSYAREAVVAFAFVRRDSWDAGVVLQATIDGATIDARVVDLPFYGRAPQ